MIFSFINPSVIKNKKINVCFIFLMYFICGYANAAANPCSPRPGWNARAMLLPVPAQLVIPFNTAEGSVLYETEATITDSDVQIADCPGPLYYGLWLAYSGHSAANEVETNVPGISLRLSAKDIWLDSGTPVILNGVFPKETGDIYKTPGGAWLMRNSGLKVELIKNSKRVINGSIEKDKSYAFMALGITGTKLFTVINFKLDNNTRVISPSCEITSNPNIRVEFGKFFNKNMPSHTGPVDNSEREFSIDLQCNENTKVSIAYDAPESSKNNILPSSITNQGSAKGIYIDFVDIGALGKMNEVITSSGKAETIKQKVRLYRSGAFSSGSVLGNATYTLNYE
ncbi:fimbrial protein [Salmonella enterica]